MSAISVWLKCTGCQTEDSVILYSPVELSMIDLNVDRLAMRKGWKVRRPASKPPVQICPKCSKEGKI